jgi:hypothetical protein
MAQKRAPSSSTSATITASTTTQSARAITTQSARAIPTRSHDKDSRAELRAGGEFGSEELTVAVLQIRDCVGSRHQSRHALQALSRQGTSPLAGWVVASSSSRLP